MCLRWRQSSKLYFNLFQLYKSDINTSLLSISEKVRSKYICGCLDLTTLLKNEYQRNNKCNKIIPVFRHQLEVLFPLVLL